MSLIWANVLAIVPTLDRCVLFVGYITHVNGNHHFSSDAKNVSS